MTLDELKNEVFYLPRTGKFYWVKGKKGRKVSGPAGTINVQGYNVICINQVDYYGHRLAWLFHYGEWPNGIVDHMNGDKADNRIQNLRCTSQAENMRNVIAPRSDNTTGYRGVSLHRPSGKFAARIKVGENYKHIGLFKTKEEAAFAYAMAKLKHHNIFMPDTPYAPVS